MNARRGSKFSLGMLITAGAWLSVGEVTVQGHPGLHHDIERISAELAQAPDCCESLIERGGLQWRGVVRGPMTNLLRWAAQQPIEDFTLESPDLAEIFRGFYV